MIDISQHTLYKEELKNVKQFMQRRYVDRFTTTKTLTKNVSCGKKNMSNMAKEWNFLEDGSKNYDLDVIKGTKRNIEELHGNRKKRKINHLDKSLGMHDIKFNFPLFSNNLMSVLTLRLFSYY